MTQSPKQGNEARGGRDTLVNGSLASALVLASDVCALSPLLPDETQGPVYLLNCTKEALACEQGFERGYESVKILLICCGT